jgi:hypothetical protein
MMTDSNWETWAAAWNDRWTHLAFNVARNREEGDPVAILCSNDEDIAQVRNRARVWCRKYVPLVGKWRSVVLRNKAQEYVTKVEYDHQSQKMLKRTVPANSDADNEQRRNLAFARAFFETDGDALGVVRDLPCVAVTAEAIRRAYAFPERLFARPDLDMASVAPLGLKLFQHEDFHGTVMADARLSDEQGCAFAHEAIAAYLAGEVGNPLLSDIISEVMQ